MTYSKKNRERFYAEQAARILGKSWSLGYDRESPDFIVTENIKQFGLEVCDIFTGRQSSKGSFLRRKESDNQKTVDKLRKEYEAVTDVPLTVRLIGEMSAENMSTLVPAIVAHDLVSKPIGYQGFIDNGNGLHIFITKALRTDWYSVNDRVGWVDQDPTSYIISTIRKKSRLLSEYRKCNLEEMRLLLIANCIYNSGRMLAPKETSFDLCGFDTVYFYAYPGAITILKSI